MHLLINTGIDSEQWQTFLINNSFASPFQSYPYYCLINSIPGYSADAFAVLINEEIVALCVATCQKEQGIKSYFSKRAIIYGGPIINDNAKEELTFLIKSIHNYYRKKTIYIEIRNYFSYEQYDLIYKKLGWDWVPYLDININLKDKSSENVLSGMKYNRRREIKMTLNEGTIYREAKDHSEIEKLYSMLSELYNKKVKLPLPKLDFFQKMFQSSIGKTFVVLHNNNLVGGSFCLYMQNSGIFTMYYCGLRNYEKKIFPTHIGVLAAIDFGISNNLKFIDLMGAGKKDEEYGVRKYKQEFGGDLVENGRYLKICNKLFYFIGKTAINFVKLYKKQ